ncbi:YcaO-like family protein [Dehalobacter sp.]|uniref:YcaO-like family protein n=1 Tax=Dehalobacter sp. TaxID=1962289 RepID=UPI002590210A|nr:YcaO-like family protein [Dehalobacter sp.]MDJ0306423.1 YcaO-like family protein [Dehalobacter sp.]
MKTWQDISYEKPPSDFITVPFCNLNSGKLSYIPMKMLSKMYMSNGMCAGNTPEEALVQGLS